MAERTEWLNVQLDIAVQRGALTVMAITEINPALLEAADRVLPATESDGGSEVIAA